MPGDASTMKTMDKPAFLIVEDDEEIVTQMKWALAQTYDVSFAANQASAMKLFSTKHPAVTTLDLGLPPHPSDAHEQRCPPQHYVTKLYSGVLALRTKPRRMSSSTMRRAFSSGVY